MPKFTVTRNRPTVIVEELELEADSEEDALEIAKDEDYDHVWEQVDSDDSHLCHYCNGREVYEIEEA